MSSRKSKKKLNQPVKSLRLKVAQSSRKRAQGGVKSIAVVDLSGARGRQMVIPGAGPYQMIPGRDPGFIGAGRMVGNLPASQLFQRPLTPAELKRFAVNDGVKVSGKIPFGLSQLVDQTTPFTDTWFYVMSTQTQITLGSAVLIGVNPIYLCGPSNPLTQLTQMYARFMYSKLKFTYHGSAPTTTNASLVLTYIADGAALVGSGVPTPTSLVDATSWPNSNLNSLWVPATTLDVTKQLDTSDMFYTDRITGSPDTATARQNYQGAIWLATDGQIAAGQNNIYGEYFVEFELILSNLKSATQNITLRDSGAGMVVKSLQSPLSVRERGAPPQYEVKERKVHIEDLRGLEEPPSVVAKHIASLRLRGDSKSLIIAKSFEDLYFGRRSIEEVGESLYNELGESDLRPPLLQPSVVVPHSEQRSKSRDR